MRINTDKCDAGVGLYAAAAAAALTHSESDTQSKLNQHTGFCVNLPLSLSHLYPSILRLFLAASYLSPHFFFYGVLLSKTHHSRDISADGHLKHALRRDIDNKQTTNHSDDMDIEVLKHKYRART